MKSGDAPSHRAILILLAVFGVWILIAMQVVGASRTATIGTVRERDVDARSANSRGLPLRGASEGSTQQLMSTEAYTSFLPLVMDAHCSQLTLSGVVCNDLNGNGTCDAAYTQGDHTDNENGYIGAVGPIEDPPVVGAVVRASNAVSFSDPDGRYSLCLSAGMYQLTVSAAPYRFRFPSIFEIKDIAEPINVSVASETEFDITLGVGPLTIPYRLTDADLFRQGSFVDIDPTYGQVGIYRSYPEECTWWHCSGDAHRGIDLYAPEGTLVVAAAPGLVYDVDVRPDVTMVFLAHTEYEDLEPVSSEHSASRGTAGFATQGFGTSYQHLSSVAEGVVEGAFLPRGHPIGYLDAGVHLHFDAQWHYDGSPCEYRCYVDPYRDLFHTAFSWQEHDSLYGYPIYISWGSPGWWTADNLPTFHQD